MALDTDSKLSQLISELEGLKQTNHVLVNRIRAMESSKFWKLRTAWLKLKQSAGLPINEPIELDWSSVISEPEPAPFEPEASHHTAPAHSVDQATEAPEVAPKKQPAEMLQSYRQTVARYPDSAAAHHDLAIALTKAGEFAAARGSYEAAIALKPELNAIGNAIDPAQLSLVAVQNYGSSGSLFIQSLFDHHPNMLMTPGLYSTWFYGFWDNYCTYSRERDSQTLFKVEALIDEFMRVQAYWFTHEGAVQAHGLHQLGEEMNEPAYVPPETFKAALLQRLAYGGEFVGDYLSRSSFFLATYLAYADALGRKVKQPTVIVFGIHSQVKLAPLLVEDFPQTKFLYTVREPIQNFGSCVKHLISCINEGVYSDQLNVAESSLVQILNDYFLLYKDNLKGTTPLLETYRDNSRAVRLEDLHQKPRETLEAVCQWLRIPWDDALLQSTFNGKRWWNRPKSTMRVSGFTEKIISQKYSDFHNQFDRLRISSLAYRKYKLWHYSVPEYAGSVPFRLLMLLLILVPWKLELQSLPNQTRIDSTLKSFSERSRLSSRLLKSVWVRKVLSSSVFALLLLRDYFSVRVWLYQAWLDGWRQDTPEVPLLMEFSE
jgi:tetratricopeptide (TPR) repeat protein